MSYKNYMVKNRKGFHHFDVCKHSNYKVSPCNYYLCFGVENIYLRAHRWSQTKGHERVQFPIALTHIFVVWVTLNSLSSSTLGF